MSGHRCKYPFSEPRNVEYNEVFLLIYNLNVFKNKFGFIAGPANLGNSHNLHKSKIAAMNATKNQLFN